MIKELRLIFLQQVLQYHDMFIQARQLWLVDIAHLVILDQRYEEPESYLFGAVHQQAANDEIHALHIAYCIVVLGEGGEDSG